MSGEVTELKIRNQTKSVLKFLENGELEQAKEVIFQNKEILRYNLGLANFVPLIPRIRFSKVIPRNHDALKMVIDTGFQIFSNEDNINELLFFAAAKCDVEKLNYCVKTILGDNPENINQTREGDTALMFLIKYGNLADENGPRCIKILIDAGIDVNKNDYFSHNPILFLVSLYRRFVNRSQKDDLVIQNLKKSIELLLETKAVDLTFSKIDNTNMTAKDLLKELKFDGLDYYQEENGADKTVDKLFKYLINGDEANFKNSDAVLQHLNADDGNNTLLQLCCEKNLKEAAKFLIDKGANICRTTERNPKIPLEIAARRNYEEIFKYILNTNRVIIDDQLFITFLRNRPKHIKAKYFDEILKYQHLDVNIRSSNGNTPLHYAIIFSSTEAIGVLLQRGASLTVENDSQKCPLDYISPEDLEAHLDKCIIRDSYTEIDNGKYEAALNYRTLIQKHNTDNNQSELEIVKKICNSDRLCHLLNHPLVSSFIDIKWKLVEPLYKKLFIFQLLFYLLGIVSYINLDLLSYLGRILAVIYGFRIAVFSNWKINKLHETVDIMIAILMFLSVSVANNAIKYQLGVIVTIFMAFSFHLYWRFSPKFSEFHAILINILSHICSYLIYTFILTLFFGAASYIIFLVRYDSDGQTDYDDNMQANIFRDFKSILSHFYLLCVVGIFISILIMLTIINSFVYLQENCSESIKNNFKISGHKNILIFLECIENLWKREVVRKFQIMRSPFIFEEADTKVENESVKIETVKDKKKHKKDNKSKNKFLLNFYVNLNKFTSEKLHYVQLDEANVCKIKKTVTRK